MATERPRSEPTPTPEGSGPDGTIAPTPEATGKKAAIVLTPAGLLPLRAPVAFGCAFLSGILYWLAFAGMDVWPLTFVAWVPLMVALHRQPTRRATLLGWIAGWTMNVAGFIWLQHMLLEFSGFPWIVCFFFVLVVCGYQGGRIAMLGWLYGRASARGWPGPLVFAGAFVASELLFPLLFPWYYAATVHQVPVLMQVADLGGPILVGLALVAPNLALAELAIARLEGRKPVREPLLAGGVSLVLLVLYGLVRIRSVDAAAAAAPSSVVGVVQANMGLMEKRTAFDEGLLRHLELSKKAEQEDHADFVVWSETSAMSPVREEMYRQQLRLGVGRRIGVPAIFGAVIVKLVPDDRRYVLYNSGVSSQSDGTVIGRYDKQFLLTFGEYLPFGESFPILYKWSPNSGHFTPGTSLDPLPLDVGGAQHAVTALICYEDVLPRFTNDAVRHADPDLLVNMTNDAWFGDTAEPWEHLALAKFRAVEHRRFFVRGTNSGVSAVVDPVGRVVAKSRPFQQEAISATIHWMHSRTVYEVVGDWPWVLVSLATIVGAFRKRGVPLTAPSRA
jgi:apolipoprotein N-acyltransferase